MKMISLKSSDYQISSGGSCGNEISTSGLPIRKIRPRKIHCILPSSPWLADSKTNVPLGVLYIAGLLREQGHDIVVTSMLDKRYEGNIHLPEHVMDSDVHMFGFCTPQFGEALELAAYIKDRNPEALVVAGGPHPSYEPKEVKEAGRQDQYHYKGILSQRRDYCATDGRQLFDTVIVMEGEIATLQMLSDWDAGQLQPYYYGDKADAMDLDAIPFPAWDLLPHDHIYNDGVAVMKKRYFESDKVPGTWPVMSMIGTRGCPYRCTYCFVGGTLIDMADGSQLPIELLRAGNEVLSFDRITGDVEPKSVSHIWSRVADDIHELRLEDGVILRVTGDHPFVTSKGWKNAKDCQGSYVRGLWDRESKSVSGRESSKDLFGRVRNGSDGSKRSQSSNAREDTTGSVKESGCSCGRSKSSPSNEAVVNAASRREVASGAYSTDGSWQSNGQSGDARKNASDSAETVRRGASSDSACPTGKALRYYGSDRTAAYPKVGHACACSDVRVNEARQSDETTGSCSHNVGVSKTGVSGRTNQTAFSRSIQRTRASIVRALRAVWSAGHTLRRPRILDWALSIGKTSQSGYAAYFGTQGYSLFVPVLAYAGGYRDATSGLRERRMERSALLGRRVEDESVDGLGACPRGRISGEWLRVESVTFVGRGTVYPISVEGNETFFAHGIATHNCSTPWIGQAPRYRSPQNIIAEMKKAFDLGIKQVKWQDDTYTLHKTKLRELADAIYSEFGENTFASRIHTRVNTLDDHVAESLRRMSCKVTCFGIESGSQKVLDANKKNTKTKQNTDALVKAKEHGFYTIAFLVAGLAGETLDTAEETRVWLKSVRPYLDSCNLAVGIPYPGSRWWTHPQESGIDIMNYNYDDQWIVGFSARDEILVRPHGTTIEEMFRVKNDMFKFLVSEGWAKAEWDEDVRIRQQQDAAVKDGVLPDVSAVSTLTYAGH